MNLAHCMQPFSLALEELEDRAAHNISVYASNLTVHAIVR